MPLISVIVPAYNAEETIGETIRSVLNQTLTDFELIVVNDGSQDNTLEVISRFDDPRLKVFSYPNAGVSATRNRGVTHAVGTYVSFIDADDLWTADKLEAQLQALQKEPEAAVAYSWTDMIDKEGRLMGHGDRVTYSGSVHTELLVRFFISSASNALICRKAVIESGGFDEALAGAADWDFFLRLARRFSFVAVPKVGILYRIANSNAMSSNLQRQEEECVKVINLAFAQAPQSLQHFKQRSLANIYQYLYYKAIENAYTRSQGSLAARYHWRAIKADSSILKYRIYTNLRIYLKILVLLVLPPRLTKILVNSWRAYSGNFLTSTRQN